MTEDEHNKLVEVGKVFWLCLGDLVAQSVARMPAHLEVDTLAYLQDRASVYGTKYDTLLPYWRKIANIIGQS